MGLFDWFNGNGNVNNNNQARGDDPLSQALASYINTSNDQRQQYNGPIAAMQTQAGILGQGMQAAQGIGGQIGNAFANVNAGNQQVYENARQAQLALELGQQNSNNQAARLQAIQPLIQALAGNLIGGSNGSSGGLSGISTNYGAGVGYGPQRTPFGGQAGVGSNGQTWNEYLGAAKGGPGSATGQMQNPAMSGGGAGGNGMSPGSYLGYGATGQAMRPVTQTSYRYDGNPRGNSEAVQAFSSGQAYRNRDAYMGEGYQAAKPAYAAIGATQTAPYLGYQDPSTAPAPQVQPRTVNGMSFNDMLAAGKARNSSNRMAAHLARGGLAR